MAELAFHEAAYASTFAAGCQIRRAKIVQMKPVVWGVLGTARIAVDKVIPAMRKTSCVELRAIASRSPAKAEAVARRLDIPQFHGSYEALLADPAIEAIYNPLPNHLHVPLTLAAAQAGKHVLCEKPLALSASEARLLKAFDGRVRIAEAFMVRHHPQWQRVRELVRSGRIGDPRVIQASFTFFNDDPADIRNQPDLGGGALYDIGCYAVLVARHVFEAEPLRAVAMVDRAPDILTDRTTSGMLEFPAGRHLTFSVSTQCCSHQGVMVLGTQGCLEIPVPFSPAQGGASQIRIIAGGVSGNRGLIIETLPEADQYQLLVEDFSRSLRGEPAPHWNLDDAVAQMAVIDALFRSERSGTWESV